MESDRLEKKETPTGWHLDKRVPVAIIGAMVFQLIGFGWFVGQMDQRVAQLEKRSDGHALSIRDLPEKLARLDERVGTIARLLERIEKKLP